MSIHILIIAINAELRLIGNETHDKRTINARVCLGKEKIWQIEWNFQRQCKNL